jgi:hypothetical protein
MQWIEALNRTGISTGSLGPSNILAPQGLPEYQATENLASATNTNRLS